MTVDRWFEVDRAGFAANLTEDDRVRAVVELVQNCWDADGTTQVVVRLAAVPGARARWTVAVVDDAPDGFADLTHAWVLYAPSTKRADPTKRGRFNEGEKRILSLCERATVSSTRGTVEFRADGGREFDPKQRRAFGSMFTGEVRLTKPQGEAAVDLLLRLIPPPGIETTVNGETIRRPAPVRTFEASLPTVVAGEDGFVERTRKTAVALYETNPGEKAAIFEMGIPVVEIGDRWHVNIGQRVQLNRDRDNVRPAYLRQIRTEVANHAHDLLRQGDSVQTWVKEALSDPRIEPEAVTTIVTQRFGEKAVAFDPSDREANDLSAQKGYTVVHGGSLSGEEWGRVRDVGLLPRAGTVTPSPKVTTGPDGTPPIPEDNWTEGMRQMVDYTRRLGKDLLGFEPAVVVDRGQIGDGWLAAYGNRQLRFNLTKLGHRWFNEPDPERVDALLIHEFAHEMESNHYSEQFHDAICRLGARLRNSNVRLGS